MTRVRQRSLKATQPSGSRGAVPPLRGEEAERDHVEVETHGHSYRNVGGGGDRQGVRREQQDGREREGKERREACSPLTSGPQRCYQARPSRKILPGSLHIPASAGLVLQPRGAAGHCLWQPHSPALVSRPPRHLARLREACGGRGPPPSLPTPPLNPAGSRKDRAGWAPQRPLPGSSQHVQGEEADPQAGATSQGPLNPSSANSLLCDLEHTI